MRRETELVFSCILMARVCKLVSSLLFCRGLSVHPLHLHKSVSLLNPRPAAAPPLRPLPHPLLFAQHPLPPAPGAAASPGIEVCSNIRLTGALIYLGGGVLGLFLCLRNSGNSLWKTSILHQKGKWETCWARIPQIRVCY